jgi:hypothetical protein
MLFSTDLKGRVSYSYNFVYVGSGGVDLTLQSTALKLQNHFEAKFDGMFRGWFSFRIMFVDPSCPLLLLLKKNVCVPNLGWVRLVKNLPLCVPQALTVSDL